MKTACVDPELLAEALQRLSNAKSPQARRALADLVRRYGGTS